MQQSDAPIAALGDALARMAKALQDGGAEHPQVLRQTLVREVSVCIQSLQFHDRLMQQLVQARDLLTGLTPAELLAKAAAPEAKEAHLEGSIELF